MPVDVFLMRQEPLEPGIIYESVMDFSAQGPTRGLLNPPADFYGRIFEPRSAVIAYRCHFCSQALTGHYRIVCASAECRRKYHREKARDSWRRRNGKMEGCHER